MRLMTAILIIAAAASAQTYNGSFLNLPAPLYGAKTGDFEFYMNHRFFGEAFGDNTGDSFFGLDDGANVNFGLRFYARDDIYVSASHKRLGSRNTLMAGWSASPLDNISFCVEAGWSTVKPTSTGDREDGLLLDGSIAISFLQDKFHPVISFGLDDDRDLSGFGLGASFQATERFAILGEYYPADNDDSEHDCFAFGGRYNTWGHQFLLGLTNTTGIGIFDQLEGSSTDELSFAIAVRRLF